MLKIFTQATVRYIKNKTCQPGPPPLIVGWGGGPVRPFFLDTAGSYIYICIILCTLPEQEDGSEFR